MKRPKFATRQFGHYPLRRHRRGQWIAPLLGSLLAIVGFTSVIAALTSATGNRFYVLGDFEIQPLVDSNQRYALPVGIALILIGVFLHLRRREALWIAAAVLFLVAEINTVNGFDVEATSTTTGIIALLTVLLLIWARDAFFVHSDYGDPGSTLRYTVGLLIAALAIAVVLLILGSPWESQPIGGVWGAFDRATGLLTMTEPTGFEEGFPRLIPLIIGVIGALTLTLITAQLFRRPEPPQEAANRDEVERVVRAYGEDTLSFFKLRKDVKYLFSDDRNGMLSYRVEGGVLMIAGDPVGEARSFPSLLRRTCEFAEGAGLKVGALGASATFAEIAREAGLRAFYIGDEAIVNTEQFTLDGRGIKKVRQAVMRIERNGYFAELRDHRDLSHSELLDLEEISQRWRRGQEERGFSMGLGTITGDFLGDSVLIIARNEDGEVGGYLHFVPVYGRPAMSMSFMCHDPSTPNGMTEFLIVRSIQLLRERGIQEISLNFAGFGRLFESPGYTRLKNLVSWSFRTLTPFQVESLYRFNRKFNPHWEPRYLLYEGRFGLPRAGYAAMRAEGQVWGSGMRRAIARFGFARR